MQTMEQRVRDETGHDLPEPRLAIGETGVAKSSWMENSAQQGSVGILPAPRCGSKPHSGF